MRALKKEQAQADAMRDGPDKDFHRQRLINELYRASGEAKTGEVLKHIISLQEAGKVLMRSALLWQHRRTAGLSRAEQEAGVVPRDHCQSCTSSAMSV